MLWVSMLGKLPCIRSKLFNIIRQNAFYLYIFKLLSFLIKFKTNLQSNIFIMQILVNVNVLVSQAQ